MIRCPHGETHDGQYGYILVLVGGVKNPRYQYLESAMRRGLRLTSADRRFVSLPGTGLTLDMEFKTPAQGDSLVMVDRKTMTVSRLSTPVKRVFKVL